MDEHVAQLGKEANMQEIANRPIAKAEMLIRRPVAEVFEAFVDPAITSKFWFSKAAAGCRPVTKSPGIGKCTISPCR